MNVLQLQVTDRCKNRCAHCFRKKNTGTITEKTVTRVFEEVAAAKQQKGIESMRLVVTGGDPLILNGLLLSKILIEGCEIFDEIGVNTIFSDLSKISILAEHLGSGSSDVLTSLHAPVASVHNSIVKSQNSFSLVVNGIKACKFYGIKVGVNMVVNDRNWNYMMDEAKMLEDFGIDCLFFSPEVNFLFETTDKKLGAFFDVMYSIKAKYSFYVDTEICVTNSWFLQQKIQGGEFFARSFCPAIKKSIYIDAKGDIYPCVTSQSPIGNIMTEPLISIVNKSGLELACKYQRKEVKKR